MNTLSPTQVGNYYNKSHKWYKLLYIERESLAIHYGFWERGGSKENALINQYREIKRILDPKVGELILDSGCGVGGASLWLAEHTPAQYIGVTISDVHYREAVQNVQDRKLASRVQLLKADYFHTDFPDQKFDKIFAIESFCYAYPDPTKLYKEMFRILKPGGILVISDGVLLRKTKNITEQKMADNFCIGFKMNGWSTPSQIVSSLGTTGFIDMAVEDKTDAIEPSVHEIYWKGILGSPLRILRLLRIVSQDEDENYLALLAQKHMYDAGLFGYQIFSAKKPDQS
jgi:cyclopropane fatty-acyl-phospholipid synthase-like methyltransferase